MNILNETQRNKMKQKEGKTRQNEKIYCNQFEKIFKSEHYSCLVKMSAVTLATLEKYFKNFTEFYSVKLLDKFPSEPLNNIKKLTTFHMRKFH